MKVRIFNRKLSPVFLKAGMGITAALIIGLPASPAAADLIGRDLRHPEKSSVGKKVKKAAKKAEAQAHTNMRHARRKAKKEWDHTRRWISENECDREGRKKGPEAEKACRAKVRQNNDQVNAPSRPRYVATALVDCWKPGRDTRWGQSYESAISYMSLDDARYRVVMKIEAGRVCYNHWRDETLYTPPGAYKFLDSW